MIDHLDPTLALFREGRALPDESLSISIELGMPSGVERVTALQERAKSSPDKASAYPDGLSQREVEFLQLMADRKTDPEIADGLFISARTVHSHLGNVLNKNAVANLTEAVAYATRHGLA